jgi:hypothetical protein
MTAAALAEPLAALENTSATPDIQPLLTQLTGSKPCADILAFERTWHNWSKK